jgi:predicted DCC family thiol-disulfide oxidoreductase YuxK
MSEADAHAGRVEVFFDGDCPLCMREIALLRRMDLHTARITFTDIASSDFVALDYGKTWDEFMGQIQGRNANGQWLEGVEVFRALYGAVGLQRIVRMSRLAPIAWLLELAYGFFSQHRLALTGRSGVCAQNRCQVPGESGSPTPAAR